MLFLTLVNDNLLLKSMHDAVPGSVSVYRAQCVTLVNDNLLLKSMRDAVPGQASQAVYQYLVPFLVLVNDNLLFLIQREDGNFP